MFRPIERFTSFLFTHKAKESERQGAIDAFYCDNCQSARVKHFTYCLGNYRMTIIQTTYEHPAA